MKLWSTKKKNWNDKWDVKWSKELNKEMEIKSEEEIKQGLLVKFHQITDTTDFIPVCVKMVEGRFINMTQISCESSK